VERNITALYCFYNGITIMPIPEGALQIITVVRMLQSHPVIVWIVAIENNHFKTLFKAEPGKV